MLAGAGWHSSSPRIAIKVLRNYARSSAGESLSFNCGFTGSGRTIRLVRVSMEAVGDATGRVTHVCGAVHGLTEKVEADAAIRLRERLLTSVLESLPVAVWLVDTDGTVRSVNEEGRRILGSDVPRSVGPDLHRNFGLRDISTGQEITPKNGLIVRALEGEATIDREIELTADDYRRTSTVLRHFFAVPGRQGPGCCLR